MTELTFKPVTHDHKAFLAKAREREGFPEAYDALALEYQLAGQCNQLAWLLSNTNERPSEAVKLSLRSLEVIPDYGIYQDTLARCYFAAGNIDKAIATQELAIKNEPFQRTMLRQLEEFKAAKASGRMGHTRPSLSSTPP